jgi:hypothetical protein
MADDCIGQPAACGCCKLPSHWATLHMTVLQPPLAQSNNCSKDMLRTIRASTHLSRSRQATYMTAFCALQQHQLPPLWQHVSHSIHQFSLRLQQPSQQQQLSRHSHQP